MLPRVQSFVQQVSHKPAMRLEVAKHLGHRAVQASFLPTNSGQREGTGWFPPLYTGFQALSWSALTYVIRAPTPSGGITPTGPLSFPPLIPPFPAFHTCGSSSHLLFPLWPATFCPPSWVAGFLQMSPFMAVFFSCWGCLEEDQTRWVFPELKVLGVLCICGRTPGIERYPTSLLAAGH